MLTPDRKVRKLMQEYQKTGEVGRAALRSDLDPKTARKYLEAGKAPSQMPIEHSWKTRPDPFAKHWAAAEAMLREAPELEGRALFEWLCEQHPGVYDEGQLRTFQRKLRRWRALSGPPKEVFFPQEHTPGERMETDFTWMNELGITIRGEPFLHLLCHCVLAYSNWEWATICCSESLLALKKGIGGTLFRLGRIPRENWTDHSSAATHAIGDGREFNPAYLDLMGHYGMKPRTIGLDSPNENGDIESANGALKRRIKQYLLLRGSRDFGSVEEYVAFLNEVLEKANRLRCKRVGEELEAMRELEVALLPEFEEEEARVSSWSTAQISRNTYSVPSRVKGEMIAARVYEDRIEVYFHGVHQLTTSRLIGEGKHAVNYRHVIPWLVRKPGAFRHYRYRDDMFPTEAFRWAYDELQKAGGERRADLEYLRILNHAAQTMEIRVEKALMECRRQGIVPRWSAVLEFAPGEGQSDVPELKPLKVDLAEYDRLLKGPEVIE